MFETTTTIPTGPFLCFVVYASGLFGALWSRARRVCKRLGPQEWRRRRLRAILVRPERWEGLTDADLLDLVHEQCLLYGRTQHAGRLALLRSLYDLAVARFDPRRRAQLLDRVARAIQSLHAQHRVTTGAGWLKALVPFLFDDPYLGVVEMAAFEYATLLPNEDGDALGGPALMVDTASRLDSDGRRSAAMLAAVLRLGDRRATALVRDARNTLDANGRHLLLQAPKPFVAAAYVDFLMDWLEESALANDEDTFVHAAWALERLAEQAAAGGVLEVVRRFPGSDGDTDDPRRVVAHWTVAQYAQRLLPRLLGVAQTRPGSSLASLFAAWGLRAQNRGPLEKETPVGVLVH